MKYYDLDIKLKYPEFEATIEHMPETVKNARNLKDGYIRGCSIQWGNVIDTISKDETFCLAYSIAKSRSTAVTDANLVNIYLIMRFSLSHLAAGHIAEFGSANGGSGLFMATVARKYCPDLQVLCFDTFEGMPSTDSSRDAHKKGDFEGIDFNEINSVAASLNLQNISFIKGLLQETAPMILPNFSPIVMTHIDVDIYESVKCAYNIIKEHMVPGGYIVFDDPLAPSCIGALEAVEECLVRRDQLHAEQAWPHLVFRAP